MQCEQMIKFQLAYFTLYYVITQELLYIIIDKF